MANINEFLKEPVMFKALLKIKRKSLLVTEIQKKTSRS